MDKGEDFEDNRSQKTTRRESRTHHEKMVAGIQESRDNEGFLSSEDKEYLKRMGALTGALGGLICAGKFYVENMDNDDEGIMDFTEANESIIDAFYEVIGAEQASSLDYSAQVAEQGMQIYGGQMLELASDPQNMQYVNEALEVGSSLF